LVVAAGYGDASRSVELRGEALFDVVHDAERPFSVRAGGAEIHDLGTAFTVSTDPGAAVRVAVTKGRVSIGPAGAPASAGTVLAAGDRALLTGGHAEVERSAELDVDLAWTRGRLVFVETPLEEVAVELWRWYGAQLRIEDPALRSRELTASFQGESLAEVLQVVRLAAGAELEMRGDTAILRSGGRPRAR
jgi:transmembrane sensor